MNRPKNSRLNCLRKMPPLKHKKDGVPYDVMESEVVDWMIQQPEVRQWLYDKLTDKTGGKMPEFITYNHETGTDIICACLSERFSATSSSSRFSLV